MGELKHRRKVRFDSGVAKKPEAAALQYVLSHPEERIGETTRRFGIPSGHVVRPAQANGLFGSEEVLVGVQQYQEEVETPVQGVRRR